jgi:queuine tRNA-ribosyltransferase
MPLSSGERSGTADAVMTRNAPEFNVAATCGRARRAKLHTPHGVVDTPAFMPVGTRAAVKGVSPEQLAQTGTQVLLANTYHLMLRPGADVVAELGGLHRLMNWPGVILTDSGGFQVYSLAEMRRIDDDGVAFRSHIDGDLVRLTPESAMQIQSQLGADIIMAFDECPPLPATERELAEAVRRTIAWAARSRAAHCRADQALYGIVQGGLDVALRQHCLDALVEIGFDGYALGGLSVGEPPAQMHAFLDAFADRMPADRPRYLMGVGTPVDLVRAVAAGIDQFDCVLPTRNGRKGYAFTSGGVLRLRNAQHRTSTEPLDDTCSCPTCRGYARGYLRHLILSDEVLGATLVSIHNIHFYQELMRQMRDAIADGSLPAWQQAFERGPLAAHDEQESE